jgi:uncharacterized repeat protein (TIGR02543 family)
MKKSISKIVISVLVIMSFCVTSVFAANPNYNQVFAPLNVKVGQEFEIELYGDNWRLEGQYDGEECYIPDSWSLEGANEYPRSAYFTSKYEIFWSWDEEFISTVKLDYPGKYKITAEINTAICKEYDLYDVSEGGRWSTNSNVEYRKVEYINVKGKVKFNANKGTVSTKEKYYSYGSKYGKLAKAKRKGYKFLGWYTKKTGGNKIKASTRYKAEEAITTLYAHWGK